MKTQEQQLHLYQEATCPSCGHLFTPLFATHVYCSGKCRQKAYRLRKQAVTVVKSVTGSDSESRKSPYSSTGLLSQNETFND
jgi:uncharacterized OB-fold protein